MPLITNRTSSHKAINAIFRIAHKKVLPAYTKKCQCTVEKVCNLEPSLKSSEKVIIPVVADMLANGSAFQNVIISFIWWQSETNINSKGSGKDPTINAIALLLNL